MAGMWLIHAHLFLGFERSRIALLAGGNGQAAIQVRTARLHPQSASRVLDQRTVESGDYHSFLGFPDFIEDTSVRVEDHRIAGSDFIIVHSDSIGENEEQAV